MKRSREMILNKENLLTEVLEFLNLWPILGSRDEGRTWKCLYNNLFMDLVVKDEDKDSHSWFSSFRVWRNWKIKLHLLNGGQVWSGTRAKTFGIILDWNGSGFIFTCDASPARGNWTFMKMQNADSTHVTLVQFRYKESGLEGEERCRKTDYWTAHVD